MYSSSCAVADISTRVRSMNRHYDIFLGWDGQDDAEGKQRLPAAESNTTQSNTRSRATQATRPAQPRPASPLQPCSTTQESIRGSSPHTPSSHHARLHWYRHSPLPLHTLPSPLLTLTRDSGAVEACDAHHNVAVVCLTAAQSTSGVSRAH